MGFGGDLDIGEGQAEETAVALGRGQVPTLFGQCGGNDPVAQRLAVDQHTVAVEDDEAEPHSVRRPAQTADRSRRTPDHATLRLIPPGCPKAPQRLNRSGGTAASGRDDTALARQGTEGWRCQAVRLRTIRW